MATAPGHVEAVRHLVIDALSADQLRALGEISGAVLEGIHREPPGPDTGPPAS